MLDATEAETWTSRLIATAIVELEKVNEAAKVSSVEKDRVHVRFLQCMLLIAEFRKGIPDTDQTLLQILVAKRDEIDDDAQSNTGVDEYAAFESGIRASSALHTSHDDGIVATQRDILSRLSRISAATTSMPDEAAYTAPDTEDGLKTHRLKVLEIIHTLVLTPRGTNKGAGFGAFI